MALQLRESSPDQWTARVLRYLDSAETADREKARQLLREAGPEQALHELAEILKQSVEVPRWVAIWQNPFLFLMLGWLSTLLTFGAGKHLLGRLSLLTICFCLAFVVPAAAWCWRHGRLGRTVERRIDNAMTAFLAEAGLARSGGAVFPLLDVAALVIRYPTLERDNRRLLTQLQNALARLLPRLADDEAAALTPAQRALLRDWVASAAAPATSPAPEPLVVGALLSLAAVRDPAAIPDAVWLARHHSSERLRTAAAACARAAGSRDALSDPR